MRGVVGLSLLDAFQVEGPRHEEEQTEQVGIF